MAFDLQQGLSETLVFDVVQLEATGFVHQDRDALERGLHHLWPLDVGSLDALVLEIHARGLAVFAIQSKVGAEGWFLARQLTVVDQQGVEVARLGV
ncbi:MAG: hypothetical protein H6734_19465 [Alphaproteobacteria bacterium]|nr:hypothetical protein [Alphaproteobacteria bacterium]